MTRQTSLRVERLDDRIVPSLLTTRVTGEIDSAPVPADALNPAMSGDGRFVAFVTTARLDQSGANDSNGTADVYLKDRLTGTLTLVSQPTGTQGGAMGVNSNTRPSVSDDGRFVAFEQTTVTAVLIPRVPPRYVYVPHTYVYLRDTQANTTTTVAEANNAHLSADGRFLTFTSAVVSPGPTDGNGILPDIFLHDRVNQTNTVVSTDAAGQQGDYGYTIDSAVSRDGRYVAIISSAGTLVPGDTNSRTDVFRKDTVSGAITRVSVASDGTQADGESGQIRVSVSDDGRFVVFQSDAANLVAGDTNGATDVFLRDVVAGTTIRLSGDAAGGQGNAASQNPTLSGNGRFVAFESSATNLVSGGSSGLQEVYVKDRITGVITRANGNGTVGNGLAFGPVLSRDGRFVAYRSTATNLVPDDGNWYSDVFVTQRPPAPAYATGVAVGGSTVRVYNANSTTRHDFQAYPGFTGGVFVSLGDVTGDGVEDIVTGTGAGGSANVRLFDGATGVMLVSFYAYPEAFVGGVSVAAGDVNGDGFADIVCGPGAGGGSNVRVFDGRRVAAGRDPLQPLSAGGALVASFFAYPDGFTGGVRVAVGDVNGDGFADVICVPGAGGGPNVRVFDGRQVSLGNTSLGSLSSGGAMVRSFHGMPSAFTGGLFVSAGDLNNDGFADVIVGVESSGGPNVRAFDARSADMLLSVFAFDGVQTGGVRVGSTDLDQDGNDDLVVGTAPSDGVALKPGVGSYMQILSVKGGGLHRLVGFVPFGGSFGGVNVG